MSHLEQEVTNVKCHYVILLLKEILNAKSFKLYNLETHYSPKISTFNLLVDRRITEKTFIVYTITIFLL